jgi:hypothetical protein
MRYSVSPACTTYASLAASDGSGVALRAGDGAAEPVADAVALGEVVALGDAAGETDDVEVVGLPHAVSARTMAARPADRRIELNWG